MHETLIESELHSSNNSVHDNDHIHCLEHEWKEIDEGSERVNK